ncbi:DUF3800 domain-containing protein [Candidatus Uhrbacteria bacterium]|nr:DUF3800 domain-containing protein [Candidatus Uhrbacteria bacterium]
MNIEQLWIDESGDCGFKFDRGSSRFLVIVAVYVLDNKAEICGVFQELKAEHGFDSSFEFKFSRCKDSLKQECLRAIAQIPIAYKAIVVDKKNLKAQALI